MKNIIMFPNLNLGPFTIDPVAIVAFGRDIMWYGIIITAAIICGVMYVMRRAIKEKLLEDDVYDYALIVVTTAILFARLYYVVFDPNPHYESFIDVIAIWEGGLAIYGGIIGGALASETLGNRNRAVPRMHRNAASKPFRRRHAA